MTDTATTAEETQVGGLAPSWWARALNLRERLAAPGTPVPAPADAPHGRPASWSLGDTEGFAARLAGLGAGEDVAYALAAEAPGRLAARTAKPQWARYIEQRVAEAPAQAGRPVSASADTDGAAVFLPALRPLIAAAWAEAAADIDLAGGELGAVRTAFEERLGDRLIRQSARTLVRELHRARTQGLLAGETPRERFAAFLARLGTRRGLAELFTHYPVLARMLGQTCGLAASATVELLDRFTADRAAIVEGLLHGRDPGALVRVDLGRGDVHQGNRSVALLGFADGATVVYKPRPLDQHVLLDRAVGWANGKVPGLGLRTPRSVRGDGYGWLEFIEHGWCASPTELDRFYRRQGALLALLYAVDGVDMHYENVIACGDQPVLVDAETLLHSGLPAAVTCGSDPAADALASSVYRTCLLPSLLIGENGAMDISALGGGDGGSYPSDGLRWEAAGTDGMRLLRGPVASAAGQNRPAPQGRAAGHADHRAALLEGFRAGYDAIAEHRAELLGGAGDGGAEGGEEGGAGDGGLLARWATSPGRLIARSTRLYTTLLDESTHPDVLRDALTRDAVLAVLWAESEHDPARQRLIEDEIADLWSGDVPLFFHHPADTALRTSRGTRLDGVLPAPSLRSARDKIAAMGEVDRHDQEWIISATLAVTGANLSVGGPRSTLAGPAAPAVVPEPSRLLAAACGIADEIAARAVHGGGRVNWLGLEQVAGEHWAVLPMGGGLAQGYCGVALFLAQLGALTGAERYTALARQAVRPLPALLATLAANPGLGAAVGPGALHGLGGIVYTVARLAPLLGEGLGDCLPDALAALERAAEADALEGAEEGAEGPADLADGLAGALAAAVAAQRTYGAGAGAVARRLADRLLVRAEKRLAEQRPADPGFSHGDAGIGWALLRHAAASQEAGAPDAAYARTGAALLRAALDEALRRPTDLGWHTGLAGTALAAADVLGADLPPAGLDRCAALSGAPFESPDLSLHHGALGSLELLGVLAGQGHEGARAALGHRAGEVLGRLEDHGHRCGTPDHVPSPGFLTGLSGIGYALLRLGFPEAVPSVLLFEPDRHLCTAARQH